MKWLISYILLLSLAAVCCVLWYRYDTGVYEGQLSLNPDLFVDQEVSGGSEPRLVSVSDSIRPPPPGETEASGHWHGDHWHRTAFAESSVSSDENDGRYGVTRQGTRYLKNPMWSDRKEAHMIPEGEPLEIDWSNYNIAIGNADWWDPRTWESYRNYFGFDRPKARSNGSMPYRARIDNWGTPLQWHENIALVVAYRKRVGFCPPLEAYEKFLVLDTEYKQALLSGSTVVADSLKLEMNTLISKYQGDLPDSGSYVIDFFGDPYPGGEITPDHVSKARRAEAIKNLYIRLGIEHLYEYYENP